jgi:hypothetical protein
MDAGSKPRLTTGDTILERVNAPQSPSNVRSQWQPLLEPPSRPAGQPTASSEEATTEHTLRSRLALVRSERDALVHETRLREQALRKLKQELQDCWTATSECASVSDGQPHQVRLTERSEELQTVLMMMQRECSYQRTCELLHRRSSEAREASRRVCERAREGLAHYSHDAEVLQSRNLALQFETKQIVGSTEEHIDAAAILKADRLKRLNERRLQASPVQMASAVRFASQSCVVCRPHRYSEG